MHPSLVSRSSHRPTHAKRTAISKWLYLLSIGNCPVPTQTMVHLLSIVFTRVEEPLAQGPHLTYQASPFEPQDHFPPTMPTWTTPDVVGSSVLCFITISSPLHRPAFNRLEGTPTSQSVNVIMVQGDWHVGAPAHLSELTHGLEREKDLTCYTKKVSHPSLHLLAAAIWGFRQETFQSLLGDALDWT